MARKNEINYKNNKQKGKTALLQGKKNILTRHGDEFLEVVTKRVR